MKRQTNWQHELKQRQIKPSEEAWVKISGQLHEKQLHSNRKKYILWMAAACLAGMLLYPLFFTESTSGNEKPIVDAEASEIKPILIIKEELLVNENPKPNSLSEELEEEKTSLSNKEVAIKKPVSSPPKSDLAYQDEVEHFLTQVSLENTNKNSAIEEKAMLLLAEIENEHPTITREEIEVNLLLATVNKKIEQSSLEELTAFAAAQDLLEEAESSLEREDLKQKVWKFIKTNYENLETTLAGLK